MFEALVPPPGVTMGPRDIDRDDSGVPKGPDGSTHDRAPEEITPDNQPVPWGFPMLGIKVPDTTLRTRALAARTEKAELKSPEDEIQEMNRRATLPGALVEKGVTRGLPGVDLSMPPVPDDAEEEEVEVGEGEVVVRRVRKGERPVPQAPGDPGTGPTAPASGSGSGSSSSTASTPQAPDPEPPDDGGDSGGGRPRRGSTAARRP